MATPSFSIVPTRKVDWAVRWIEFMKDSMDLAAELRLDWEAHNCLSWCSLGIEAITGVNPFDSYAEANAVTLKGAVNVVRNSGYETLDRFLGSLLPEIPIGMAQQGDLVLVNSHWEAPREVCKILNYATALADPPLYWCITSEGLARGDLYAEGFKAFAIGRIV